MDETDETNYKSDVEDNDSVSWFETSIRWVEINVSDPGYMTMCPHMHIAEWDRVIFS